MDSVPRILVVDDNEDVQESFAAIFQKGDEEDSGKLDDLKSSLFDDEGDGDKVSARALNFDMGYASQGEEALEKIRESYKEGKPYSMAFMDVRMPPGWDGITTVINIWKEFPNTEIVICTAFSDYNWFDMVDSLGDTDKFLILKKPFDAEEVKQLALGLTKKFALVHNLESVVEERTAQLKAAQEEALQNAVMAGMADIATGVLHNIGNSLNTVMISSEIVRKGLRDSELESFTKVQAMLKEHSSNFGEFFTSHEKGKKIPDFLIDLCDCLLKEKDLNIKEMDNIIKGTNFIKELVASQQNLAKFKGQIKELDITKEFNDIIPMIQNNLNQANVKLEVDYNNTKKIMGEKLKLTQVVMNLFKNAIEAMTDTPEGERVLKIFFKERDGKLEAHFQDTGCGIKEENLAKIFTSSFTTKKEGHGFGLHNSANCMTEMGGKLVAESPGEEKGSTFIITMKLA